VLALFLISLFFPFFLALRFAGRRAAIAHCRAVVERLLFFLLFFQKKTRPPFFLSLLFPSSFRHQAARQLGKKERVAKSLFLLSSPPSFFAQGTRSSKLFFSLFLFLFPLPFFGVIAGEAEPSRTQSKSTPLPFFSPSSLCVFSPPHLPQGCEKNPVQYVDGRAFFPLFFFPQDREPK